MHTEYVLPGSIASTFDGPAFTAPGLFCSAQRLHLDRPVVRERHLPPAPLLLPRLTGLGHLSQTRRSFAAVLALEIALERLGLGLALESTRLRRRLMRCV